MQAVNHEQDQSLPNQAEVIAIPIEFIAYCLLIILAIVLRMASLGDALITDVEAHQALAAYHAYDANAIGTPQAASSPMLYWMQVASFTAFGGSEFASRLPTVLAGIVLVLLPLLFRARIGAERSFLLSLIFAFSPISITAARLSDATNFSMIFLMLSFWAAWRYWDSRNRSDALLLAGFVGALLFLGDSGGLLLGLLAVLAVVISVAWEIYRAPYENDTVGDEILSEWRSRIEGFPKLAALAVVATVTVLISTGFVLYPSGFNMLGELLSGALQGFFTPSLNDAPPVFALLALFVYSPILVIFGIISAVTLISHRSTWLDRYAIVFALVLFAFLLIYQGSKPAYALWLVLPLGYLTARLVSASLLNVMPTFLSMDNYTSDNPNHYAWIKWAIACVILAGAFMLSLNLAELGRTMRDYVETDNLILIGRMGWFIIMSMLLVVGFFLFASIWGNRNSYQGYVLGFFIYMLIFGAGSGWNTSVTNLSNPAELWYTTAVSPDAYELRETLIEIARRDSGGFPQIPITILLDESAGITDNGLIAWLVRDFEQTRFVSSLNDAARDEIVLLPILEEEPNLEGSYVGQSFTIRHASSEAYISPMEWLSWFSQRSTRPYLAGEDLTVLWLRIDVYDGIPASERPQG